MIPVLLAAALAQDAEIETVAQVRHDLFGDQMVPLWSYVRLHQPADTVEVDGYVGAEWIAGVDHPGDFDLYRLSVTQPVGDLRWGVGRQRAIGSLRGQTFDGAQLERDVGAFTIGAWGGVARHQDLDDLLDGAGIGRVEASYRNRSVWARVGGQVEAGAETPLVARQDVEARLRGHEGVRPELAARAVVAENEDGLTPEWLEARASARVGDAPVRAELRGTHREAADPTSLFGDAILDTLGGEAVNEVGLGLRVSGAHWSSLHGAYALTAHARPDGDTYGHGADVQYTSSPAGVVRVVPAYRFRAGPGGMFHAAYLVGLADLGDATALTTRLAAVPYQLASREVWDLVLHGGLQVDHSFGAFARVGVLADVATDRVFRHDVRGGLVLAVGGAP